MRVRTVLAELGIHNAFASGRTLEKEVAVGDLGPESELGADALELVGLPEWAEGGGQVAEGSIVLVHCGASVPDELAVPAEGVVAFADGRPLGELADALAALPSRVGALEAAKDRLFQAFRDSYDLQQFANRAFEVIGNPLMVVNSDRRLLASAGPFPADRADVLDELNQGYVSEEVNQQLEADGIIDDVRRAHHAIVSDNPRFGQRWVTAIISYHHLELGRFDVLEAERPITPLGLELIDFACSLAGIMIDRLGLAGERAGSGSSVLSDMLSNSFSNEKTMRAQLSLTDLPLDDAYVLLRVSGGGLADVAYQKRVGRLVARVVGRSLWCVKDGFVCILLPIGRSKAQGFDGYERVERMLRENEELAGALANNGLTVCVSEPFEQLSFITSRLRQCLALSECMSMGVGGQSILYFWRLRLESMAATAPSFEQVDMMLDKRVVAMQQYDDEHGTQYFDTAVMSVELPGSPSEVAEVLHVHRNTYFYRVNKIRELFYLDLKQGDDRLAVSFSAHVIRGMGERLHVATDAARQ